MSASWFKTSEMMPILGVLLFFFVLSCEALADSRPETDIKTIRIITPQWEGQTNPDGTGLFFDIVDAVYSPVGIQMVFSFAPWKRCQAIVTQGELADAMLCVWKEHAGCNNQLIPRYPLYVEHTAVVRKKASGIVWQGIHTLDYKRAVWLRGYNYETDPHLKDIQLARWEEADSYEKAWMHLNRDHVDLYIEALIDLEHYICTNGVDRNLYEIKILWSQTSYVAFFDSARSRQMIEIYDKRIKRLIQTGELANIYKKWGQPFPDVFTASVDAGEQE